MSSKSVAIDLLSRWQRRSETGSHDFATPGDCYEVIKKMLALGMPLQALEAADEACARWSEDLLLAQARGLALARSGVAEEAAKQLREVVERLRQSTKPDPFLLEEALGVLARTEKDFAARTQDGDSRREHLEQSLLLYSEAYEATGGYWSGINVATLQTLLDRPEEAEQTATAIIEDCRQRLNANEEDAEPNEDYWLLATLGEAHLNLRDRVMAESWYRKAAQAANDRYGDLSTTKLHVRWLLNHLGLPESLNDEWIPLPNVAVFTGHLIDSPDRETPRFPAQRETQVRESIRQWLLENNVAIGYASAACGADILFHEMLHEIGGESHVILPYHEEAFIRTSVAPAGDPMWVDRFWGVIDKAAEVIRAGREQTEFGAWHYRYTNQIIAGLAKYRAREINSQLLGLAVWNGQPGDIGGTCDALGHWSETGIPMSFVELPSEPDSQATAYPVRELDSEFSLRVPDATATPLWDSRVLYLLFADAAGFSQLADREIRLFMSEYLGRVAKLLQEFESDVVVKETIGDGLYVAFETLSSAGNFALQLANMVETTDWPSLGMNVQLRLRVALHAGPVIVCRDPVTGLMSAVGSHVSRAARLEPKTPLGLVYASEAFAALTNLAENRSFRCRYVKQLEWAKRYGTFPTFLVTKT